MNYIYYDILFFIINNKRYKLYTIEIIFNLISNIKLTYNKYYLKVLNIFIYEIIISCVQ